MRCSWTTRTDLGATLATQNGRRRRQKNLSATCNQLINIGIVCEIRRDGDIYAQTLPATSAWSATSTFSDIHTAVGSTGSPSDAAFMFYFRYPADSDISFIRSKAQGAITFS